MLVSDLHGPLVSVVIPCLNEAMHLDSLLDAIRAQDVAIHEVIVVDNGSSDDSQAIVERYRQRQPSLPLLTLTCSIPGAAAAMNVGIRAATGDIIVRLDGHCAPYPNYIGQAVAELLQQGDVGVVGGVWETVPGRETLVGRAIAGVLAHGLATGGAAYRRSADVGPPHDVETVPFGCYRKALWQELGGYNEFLPISEDYLFNYRTRRAGYRVVLAPAIRCRYFARGTLAQLASQYFHYGWGKAEMLKTYPGSVRWRQIVPGGFTASLVTLTAAGFFAPPARRALGALLVTYASVLLMASLELAWPKKAWRIVPAYVAAFCVVQLAWGAGACVNIATFGRWPRWGPSQSRLVPHRPNQDFDSAHRLGVRPSRPLVEEPRRDSRRDY